MTDSPRPADDGTTIDESDAAAIVHELQSEPGEDDPAIAQEHPTEDNA